MYSAMCRCSLLIAVASVIGWGSIADGGTVVDLPGLYSTGCNNAGTPQSLYYKDPHYTCNGSKPVVQLINPSWVGNSGASRWVGLGSNGWYHYFPAGDYWYTTTFTIADDIDTATVRLRLSVAGDDSVRAYVNDHDMGISAGMSQLTGYTFTDHFQTGVNTLKFKVHNQGGPFGLQVRIASFTGQTLDVQPEPEPEPEPVPEPATALAGLLSLSGLAAYARRREAF